MLRIQETTMNPRTASLLLAICAAGVWAAPTHAQNVHTGVVKLPQDIIYKGLPGSPQHVTLFGDSSQPGLYVDRIKFLPGMKVMPHWHPVSPFPGCPFDGRGSRFTGNPVSFKNRVGWGLYGLRDC